MKLSFLQVSCFVVAFGEVEGIFNDSRQKLCMALIREDPSLITEC